MRIVSTEQELLELSGNDVVVRGTLRRQFSVAWEHDGALAWIAVDTHDQSRYVCARGAEHASVTATAQLMSAIRADAMAQDTWLALERPVVAALARHGLALTPGDDWELRWTFEPPPYDGKGQLRWMLGTEHALVNDFLDLHAPKSSARPQDPHVRGFAMAFDGDTLVAVAADTTGTPDIGHISSVATDSRRRGEGWGGEVTAWLSREQFDSGVEAVSLGMFAGNSTAIRLYERIGFTHVRQFTSGELVEK